LWVGQREISGYPESANEDPEERNRAQVGGMRGHQLDSPDPWFVALPTHSCRFADTHELEVTIVEFRTNIHEHGL
ncbi:hypothetical protein CLOP_g4495, partial [Closterium sp. NIES-67]